MRILLVTATDLEIEPLGARLACSEPSESRIRTCMVGRSHIDILRTGVGMVATAVWTSRALVSGSYRLALNVGVCGAFDPALPPGTVVHVTSDRIAELGAEDDDEFRTVHELQLLGENEFPFQGGLLLNADPPAHPVIARLPTVAAITVNTVHGRETSIAEARRRFHPQVESMEGAAFMYASLAARVPFAQVRAVSNVVERRNRAAWRMREAIDALCKTTLEILEAA